MTKELVERVAREMRRARFERTGIGKSYDPTLPLLEAELLDAKAAIEATLSSTGGDDGELERRLRKMAGLVYLATEATVADDISDGLTKAANRIASLNAELERVREALTKCQLRLQNERDRGDESTANLLQQIDAALNPIKQGGEDDNG